MVQLVFGYRSATRPQAANGMDIAMMEGLRPARSALELGAVGRRVQNSR